MIILTGAAGFIGSCMLARLNEENFLDVVLVDSFDSESKAENYKSKSYRELVERAHFFEWIKGKEKDVQFIIHLGARTDTTEKEWEIFEQLNLSFSKEIWNICTEHQIPLIYASSAATYGDGNLGFTDDLELLPQLQPLNPYGKSKHVFDMWVQEQQEAPFFWAGFKFFNVYGPNEYHKGRMASVIFHAYKQILKTGKLRLFRSHREDYADGEQKRDFLYVKDLIDVLWHFMEKRQNSGLYNLGTGEARTFNDLGKSVFLALRLQSIIEYFDTPIDIRDSYQYYTQANMAKLRSAGYTKEFSSLEAGVDDYVANYLLYQARY